MEGKRSCASRFEQNKQAGNIEWPIGVALLVPLLGFLLNRMLRDQLKDGGTVRSD